MGFRWVQKNISPIGVDIGADSLKLLQIARDGQAPQLLGAARVDIPSEIRYDGTKHGAYVADAIKVMLKQAKFKGKRAIVSISSASAYVQHVRVPKCDPGAVEMQLQTELRGRLPLDPSQMVMRWVTVGEVFADGATKQEVICLAASRDYVLRLVNTMRLAGLDVVGMHSEPVAILAAFEHLFEGHADANTTTMFVDIGCATTKVLIAHSRQIVFAKTICVGGDHFNRLVAELAQTSSAEARIARIREAEEGVSPQFNAVAGSMQSISSTALVKQGDKPRVTDAAELTERILTSETVEVLVDELQLCMGYHAAMFHDRPIDKMIFLGGESRQTAICQRVAQRLRLPAQVGDPLARVVRAPMTPCPNVDLQRPQPGWAVPMGLCLLPTNL